MANFKLLKPVEMDVQTQLQKGNNAPSGQFREQLGTRIFDEEGRVFEFREISGDTASTGAVLAHVDSVSSNHLADPSAATANSDKPAGVVVADSSVPVGNACFVQTRGPGLVSMRTDDAVTADSQLWKDSTNAGVAVADSDGAIAIGHAYSTDTGSVLAADDYRLDVY